MKLKYFLYIIGLVFIFSIIGNIVQYFKSPTIKPVTNTKTISKTDTVTQIKYITLKKIIAKIDTVTINNQQVAVASPDTLIHSDEDTLKVKYFFPPANYFSIDWTKHNRVIYKTDSIFVNTTETIQNHSFWNSLNYSIYAGPGIDLFSHQIGIYIGIGITWNIKNIF